MEEEEEIGTDSQLKSITDLPEEILEHILMKISPYNDLMSASLVCSSWHRLVQGKSCNQGRKVCPIRASNPRPPEN